MNDHTLFIGSAGGVFPDVTEQTGPLWAKVTRRMVERVDKLPARSMSEIEKRLMDELAAAGSRQAKRRITRDLAKVSSKRARRASRSAPQRSSDILDVRVR